MAAHSLNLSLVSIGSEENTAFLHVLAETKC